MLVSLVLSVRVYVPRPGRCCGCASFSDVCCARCASMTREPHRNGGGREERSRGRGESRRGAAVPVPPQCEVSAESRRFCSLLCCRRFRQSLLCACREYTELGPGAATVRAVTEVVRAFATLPRKQHPHCVHGDRCCCDLPRFTSFQQLHVESSFSQRKRSWLPPFTRVRLAWSSC
jgi:hypothetical protein